MRLIGRILVWIVGIIVALVLLLLASVGVDGLLMGGRLEPLVNTTIPGNVAVRAFVARPKTPGRYPAVVMIHEFWGLKPDVVEKAQALADQGYVVVAPDVFRGSTTSWIPRAIWQVITTPAAQVDTDLTTVTDWLKTQKDVNPQKIGIIGFCFGGGSALRFSSGTGAFAATAVFYGTPITDPARLKQLGGPVLGIFGGADASIPQTEVRALDAALGQAAVAHTISVYENQPHAFVGGITQINQGGPAGEAWAELLAFFDKNLKGGSGVAQVPAGGWGAGAARGAAAWAMPRLLHVFVCDPAVRPA